MVIKYALVAVIVVYVALLLIFTSGSTKSFAAVEKKVEASLDTKAMKRQEVQAEALLWLNSADYEGVMLYTAESSMSAQEILLVKTKTTEQAEEVKAAVEQRRANRRNDFDGYAPDQVQLLDEAQISVRGKFVFYAVSPKAETYKSVFSKSL
mgnify:CR=1 FL=1